MIILKQFLIACGLLFGGFFLINQALFSPWALNKAKEGQLFATNCILLFDSSSICSHLQILLPTLLVAPAIFILFSSIKIFSGYLAVIGLLSFAFLYTNVSMDKSYITACHFLEILYCCAGILCFSYQKAQMKS